MLVENFLWKAGRSPLWGLSRKAWRAADREAISKRTYAVASAAYALWIVHGVMIGSMPIIVFNALALLLGAAILVLKLRDPTIPRNA